MGQWVVFLSNLLKLNMNKFLAVFCLAAAANAAPKADADPYLLYGGYAGGLGYAGYGGLGYAGYGGLGYGGLYGGYLGYAAAPVVATGIASHSPSVSVHIAGLDAAAAPAVAEATLLPDAMSPTLPELSMLPRGRLRLRLMLMLTPTCTTADSDTLDMADTLDTDTLVCHTPDTD